MSAERVLNFVEVCASDDLWIGEMEAFDVGEHEVIVINVEGRFHAYDGICPHQSVPLIEGALEDGVLTCRAHHWSFDAATGQGVNPASHCLRRFALRVQDGKVMVCDQPVDT